MKVSSVLLSVAVCVAVASYASEAPPGYTTVDLMVVYTPAALAHMGGEANMNVLIADTVRQANELHSNSDTQVYLNLVHTAQTDYTESDYATDLLRLTKNDGQPNCMDEVHALRDQYGADFVYLFSYRTDTVGVAWQLDNTSGQPDRAFGYVSVYFDPVYNYTLVRNLGLNMGCGFSKTQAWHPTPPPGLFSYSAGWQWDDSQSSSGGYCTVMTMEDFNNDGYPPEYKMVPHFSNPDIKYVGDASNPTGDAVNGDNARTIREMRSVFAGYRSSDGDPPLPVTSNYAYSASFEVDFEGWESNFAWARQTGETPNKNTGPSRAAEGAWYVYADSGGYGGQTAWLWKTFDFTSVSKLGLGFWRHMYGRNMGTLSVGISTNNGAQWDEIWTQSGEQNLSWRWIRCPLTAYEGQSNVTIRFSGLLGSKTGDMALDGITVTGVVTVAESNNDQDGDGLPDKWETLYYGGATNANPDTMASNGVNTVWETYVIGMDPTSADSQFHVTWADGVLYWPAVSGRVYSVWQADNLHQVFQPLATNIIWPQSNYIDTVSSTQRFYRIGVQLAE